MGDELGALAGGGMLLLIGLLIWAFLREMGWVSGDKLRWLGRCFLMVLGAGLTYRAVGALIYFVIYGPVGNATEYTVIFRSKGLEEMYIALCNPAWHGLLRGLFAYLGHGIGSVLFGEYLLGGELLAFGCTFAGSALLISRMKRLWGEKTGEELGFLMLCLPFGVFLFLPGWGPIAFLLGAALFHQLGRWLPERQWALPSWLYGVMLSVSSIFSAGMVYALATGKLM